MAGINEPWGRRRKRREPGKSPGFQASMCGDGDRGRVERDEINPVYLPKLREILKGWYGSGLDIGRKQNCNKFL